MKHVRILAAGALLVAAVGAHGATVAPQPTGGSPSLPPPRVSDCISFALLDDKCTKDWYTCKRGAKPETCADAWEECCTLPGQGARTKLGGAEPVATNR